jgi:hypothetical protein
LRVFADAGEYHPQPEWCENIPHPVEQSRGQTGSGDAYSPGWFELPLAKGASVTLVATAETDARSWSSALQPATLKRTKRRNSALHLKTTSRAAKQFVVRRGRGQNGHRRLSVVSGLGPRLADLRARTAGGRHGGRSETIAAHLRQI